MSEFGLSAREVDLIRSVFQRHQEVVCAKIFGSRAKGVANPNSDVDIALWGSLTTQNLAAIAGELEELPLPYTFDIQDYNVIRNEPLREHINRVGKLLYSNPIAESGLQS